MATLTLNKIWHHFRTIYTHRKWVRHYCRLAHIRWRGWKHDLSKYSPIEFFESARYWTGIDSPINACKRENGISKAWLHHRGKNKHHWAYWADNFSEGLIVHPMPQNDFVEMVCDFLAAGRTYHGKNFSYNKELHWWMHEREHGSKAMHWKNKKMLDIIFSDFNKAEELSSILNNSSPEQLIKHNYIQQVWKANS